MKALITGIVFCGLFLTAGGARAENVVYTQTVTTNFKWHWPLQTVRTTTTTQTIPYYPAGRVILLIDENVSKYRFHYSSRASKNDWGYFFRPGDRVYSRQVPSSYGYPTSYSQVLVVK